MFTPPSPRLDENRIRKYFAVIEASALICAEYRAGRHDVLVWNARRIGEAILWLLGDEDTPLDLHHLAEYLVDNGKLPAEIASYIETLRTAGTLPGQVAELETDRTTLDACVRAVPTVARWLYHDSAHARPMSDALMSAVADLEAPTPRVPNDYRLAKENEEYRTNMHLARLEVARLQAMLGPDPVGRARRRQLLTAVLLVAMFAAGVALGWTQKPAEKITVSTPVAAPIAPVAAAVVPAMAAAPVAAPAAAVAPQAPTPAVAIAEPASPVAAPAPPEPAAEVAPPPAESAAEPAKVAGCPAGTLQVVEKTLRLHRGPFPRPAWPEPQGKFLAAKVAAFCIDQHPVTAGKYGDWLKDHNAGQYAKQVARGGNLKVGARDLPMNRVHWSEAAEFCTGAGGALPTVAQWEVAQRLPSPPEQSPKTGEWAQDSFPTSLFGYSKEQLPDCKDGKCDHLYHGGAVDPPRPRDPLLRWLQRGPGQPAVPFVGFRCAYPHE